MAAVALVRAVGHVPANVDGRDQDVKKASDQAFRRWTSKDPQHEIFREFIRRERNNILKEYAFAIHPLEDVPVAIELTLRSIGEGKTLKVQDAVAIGMNVYRPVLDGYREGDDARDVLADAIAWWHAELRAIERQLHPAA